MQKGKRMSNDEFKERGNEIHNGNIEYLEPYKGSKILMLMFCLICRGEPFPQRPNDHLQGKGCPHCARKITNQAIKQAREDSNQKAAQAFELKVMKIHGDKFEYLTPYIHSMTPMKMRCKKTGETFHRTPHDHLRGRGCNCCVNKTEGIVRDALNEMLSSHGLKATISGSKETKGVGRMDITIHTDDGKIVGFIEVDGEHHFKDVKLWKSKAMDVQKQDLKKYMNAIENEYWVVRIEQEWVYRSHPRGETKWIDRLTETILKLVGNVKPSIDDMFLSNKKDKYHEHACYTYIKKS